MESNEKELHNEALRWIEKLNFLINDERYSSLIEAEITKDTAKHQNNIFNLQESLAKLNERIWPRVYVEFSYYYGSENCDYLRSDKPFTVKAKGHLSLVQPYIYVTMTYGMKAPTPNKRRRRRSLPAELKVI